MGGGTYPGGLLSSMSQSANLHNAYSDFSNRILIEKQAQYAAMTIQKMAAMQLGNMAYPAKKSFVEDLRSRVDDWLSDAFRFSKQ